MFGERPNNLIHNQGLYYNLLMTHVTDLLPTAYGRQCGSHILKGFFVRVCAHLDCYVATAVATLGPPVSLADALDMVIQDEFIEACSAESALDALEQLHEEIEGMIQGEKTDPYGSGAVGSAYSFW